MKLPALLFVSLSLGCVAQTPAPPPASGTDPLKDPLTENPPAASSVTPMSDKEETGAMSDILPGFVDPLTLPGEQGAAFGSLFPSALWPLPPDEEFEESPPPPLASAVSEGGALTPGIIASSFGEAAPPALHDPQGLLPAADAAALRSLLEQSVNSRGGFRMSLVLLGGAQQVPVSLDFDALVSRWFGGAKGLLVVYYAGHPERTLAWFSPAARDSHGGETMRSVLELGTKEASRLSSPLQQLQRFCFRTAIRLDRLHRDGDLPQPDEAPAPLAAATVEQPSSMLWWAFAIGAQAAGLGAAAVWWLRRKRAANRGEEVILLPPQECTPRLGGMHSGGSGALLAFGSGAQPRKGLA